MSWPRSISYRGERAPVDHAIQCQFSHGKGCRANLAAEGRRDAVRPAFEGNCRGKEPGSGCCHPDTTEGTIVTLFTSDDQAYLLRRLGQNDCILFLGAGFSREASNRLSQPMPLSQDLCKALWRFLGYGGEWDGTPLPDMYQALLASGKSYVEISAFLEELLLTSEVPDAYDHLTRPFWYRIYTTNVDDLVKRVYRRVPGSPTLQILGFPQDELAERDQTLDRIQAVFLHGHLPCRPDELTFSVRQFARRASDQSPLYQAFVSDYSTRPTLFIGTELNEPLFWQHLEVREQRRRGISEQRPKSFLEPISKTPWGLCTVSSGVSFGAC